MTVRELLRLSVSLVAFAGPLLCAAQPASDKELFQAVAKGDMGAVRVILDNGANIDSRNERGDTPVIVMAAGSPDDAASVKLLLSWGADVTAKDNRGKTAITFAQDNWDPKKIRLLKTAMAKVR